jgi:hypothetical protein
MVNNPLVRVFWGLLEACVQAVRAIKPRYHKRGQFRQSCGQLMGGWHLYCPRGFWSIAFSVNTPPPPQKGHFLYSLTLQFSSVLYSLLFSAYFRTTKSVCVFFF